MALCKPDLLTTAVSFDTDNSGGLSLHEFKSFIEDITGDAFDNVVLEGPIDSLYDHLRNACWSIFKMPTQCGEDTTTNDDEKEMIDKNGVMNMGKFPVNDSKYDGNGVLLTGFSKVDNDKTKSKEEKKYELYFCEAMVTFYLMNDVQLDWTLVDGDDVEVMTTSSTEVADASDTVGNWTIADVIAAVLNATTNASDEASTNATTTSSTAAAIIATTTTPEPTTTTVVPDEDPEVDTTAAEINIADNNNGAASIVEMEPNQPASNTIPLGGYVGMALGGVLLVFIIAALIVTRRRRKRAAAAANNSFDSIWVDEENNDMTNAGKAAEISSVGAMGVASTVATRLTTGDTEVTLMEKQAWTKREPVV